MPIHTRPERDVAHARLTNSLVILLAVGCGISVANLYYAQPLLHSIEKSFHTGPATTALIVTGSQVGYALGLALLVPIGDIIARKRLVPAVLCVTALGLVLAAISPSIGMLIGVCVLVGVGSVVAQMLVPLAASLADDSTRGAVVGKVMSGLLLGILLARTLAGVVASWTGWRGVYVVAAVAVVMLALLLAIRLPDEELHAPPSYIEVLKSVIDLFFREPVLRRRAVFGALAFAAFSVFWTTVAFVLAGAPYHYSSAVIGLFGLVGAAGALCANIAGRLADRKRVRELTASFAVVTLISLYLLFLGRHSLAAMIAGVILLDVGVQGMQVTNQSVIYALAPNARSRVTSSYMVVYFAGGALGSAVAGHVYASTGWSGICVLGALIGAVLVLGFLLDVLVQPKAPRQLATDA